MNLKLVLPAALAAGFLASQSAYAFSHCGAVEPNPRWPIETQILDIKAGLQDLGAGQGVPSEDRACAAYERGLLYHFAGKYQKAIELYSDAVGLMDTFADAYAARADAYADLGQPDKAAADYATVASLSEVDDAQDLGERCWVRAVRGHPLDLALADCDAALRTEPDDADILDSRGLVDFRMGNFAAAIADCDAALKRKSTMDGSIYVRGLAKLRSGDTAGGKADVDQAEKMNWRIAKLYAYWGVKP